jgi:hypothetical protein
MAYFYPISIALNSKNPNVLIEVRLKDDDASPTSEGLQVIVHFYDINIKQKNVKHSNIFTHSKKNTKFHLFQVFYPQGLTHPTTSAYSSVVHHERNPVYTDELKFKLPEILTPQHHLLVTFYNLKSNAKKDEV